MTDVTIEECGGVVGPGPGGHVHMRGTIAWSALSAADQASLDHLFAAKRPVNANHYYRLTRQGPKGVETVDVVEAGALPEALLTSIRTVLD